jgi:hypothetical protein
MFSSEYFSGIHSALGTKVDSQNSSYTESAKLRALSFVRNDLLRVFRLEEFYEPDEVLTVSAKEADIPENYMIHVRMMRSDKKTILKRVSINDFDEIDTGVWTIKNMGSGRKIVFKDDVTDPILRYIKKQSPLGKGDEVGLPDIFTDAVENMCAGVLLRDNRQEEGETIYQHGIRLARQAYSFYLKEISEGDLTPRSKYESEDMFFDM